MEQIATPPLQQDIPPNTPPLVDFLPEESKSTKRLIARSDDEAFIPKKVKVEELIESESILDDVHIGDSHTGEDI